ncbi:MAG: hypothetical protein N2246_03425 [Candidatus Sumerlaeia bacterium]|nr:hypothetical protein [Candidatus Sumerlaeia bacterium]
MIGGVVIIGLLLFVSIMMILMGRDEPPPQDADLRLVVSTVPDKENAYSYILSRQLKNPAGIKHRYQHCSKVLTVKIGI